MAPAAIPLLNGAPVVLVVDDEEVIREVCTIMVSDAGGKPLVGVDGVDGVEVFAENQDSIQCVVIDFSMPNMNGHQAVVEMRKMRAGLPAVMISGLKRTPEMEALCKDGTVEFLAKPFRAESLIGAINRVVEKSGSARG